MCELEHISLPRSDPMETQSSTASPVLDFSHNGILHAFWSNDIYHAFFFKLHLEGCHGSNLAYLVYEITTHQYLVPLRACSSVMPLLVTQPALHLPSPSFHGVVLSRFLPLSISFLIHVETRRPFSQINWGLGTTLQVSLGSGHNNLSFNIGKTGV